MYPCSQASRRACSKWVRCKIIAARRLTSQKLTCWPRGRKVATSIHPAAQHRMPLAKTSLSIRQLLNAAHGGHREPSFVMSANNSPLSPQRCSRCAQLMKQVRRTQRFGGLPDLCTFECPACGMSHTEECRPAIWHSAHLYRKQAKACRELAIQARGEDRKFWFRLSDGWLKLAQDDDEQIG